MTPPLLKRYLIAGQRHKWAGLAGFMTVLGLSGVAALQPAPPAVYVSQGVLVYVEPPLTFSATVTSIQQQGQALTEANLLSDEVLAFVSQQLEAQEVRVSPEKLRRSTDVDVNAEVVLQVTVEYQDTNADRANQINALLLEAMVEKSRIFNTIQLTRITENLNELLPRVEQDLRQAERRLEAYIRQEGPVLQAARDGSLVGGITASQNEQRALRLRLTGLDAQIQSLQQRLGLTPDQAYASSALSADPIIASLRTQIYQNETQISVLQQRLRPEHPQMAELLNQQRAFEELLQQRVQEVIGGNQVAAPLQDTERIRQDSSLDPARQQLANLLVGLQAERETQQQLLAAQTRLEQELRAEYETLPNKQLEQARLTREVELKGAFFNEIQARLEDVTLAEKETVGSLAIAQPPQTTTGDVEANNPLVILIAGGVVGLLVGGGLIVLLDSLDATFHTLPDLQNALRQQEIPVLGLLPALPTPLDPDTIPLIRDLDSPYLEAVERFRSNLRRIGGSQPPKVILMTSTISREGKSFSAYNLAIASARAGKRTLIVEADLRSPSHSHQLEVIPNPENSLEPLQYYGQPNDSIRLVPQIENLYILPSPGQQKQAAAILESTELRKVLDDARHRFDLVVIDTPALSRCNDALLLEPYTDGMVLVTRPGYTEEGMLAEVAEQFMDPDDEDVTLLGAVINGADIPMPAAHPPTDLRIDPPLTLDTLHTQSFIDSVEVDQIGVE
ncbi:MAG: hypothetical protein VKK04_09730 [Synechococcales bacterium]|nr:hypothetical protein [Synechococcales bacterium]